MHTTNTLSNEHLVFILNCFGYFGVHRTKEDTKDSALRRALGSKARGFL